MTYRDLCRALIYSGLEPEQVKIYWIEDDLDKDAVFGEILSEDGSEHWEDAEDDEFALIFSEPRELPHRLRKLDYILVETALGQTICVFPLTR